MTLFWPIRPVPFGPIKLQRFGVLICIMTDQSGTRESVKVSSSLALEMHFPFPMKTVFPWLSWNMEHLYPSRAEQNSEKCKPWRSRTELSSWRDAWPQGCLIAALYHNWAVLHGIKFPSSLHLKLGIPVGMLLVPMTIPKLHHLVVWNLYKLSDFVPCFFGVNCETHDFMWTYSFTFIVIQVSLTFRRFAWCHFVFMKDLH